MSSLQQNLLAFLNIRSGEGRLVALVLLYTILLYTANNLAYTASYALFLAEFGAANLPYAYMGIAVFATLVSFVYLKVNERLSLATGLIGIHGFLLLTLAAYWLGLFAPAPWLIFSLPIYFGVNNTLSNASFWNLLGRLYSLQQGKRLFGLLSAGENIATIATGFLAPLLVSWLGTPNLFLAATLVMATTLGVLLYLVRTNTARLAEPAEEPSAADQLSPAPSLVKDRYILLIIGLTSLFIVSAYFVDNIFYSLAEIQYPDEDSLASFIGVFFGVYGLLSLGAQLFVAGRVLNRFGIRSIILTTPAGLLAITLLFALTGTLSDWQFALFWLAVGANMFCVVLDAIDSTAVSVIFQPLPDRQRTQAQTLVNGIIYPLVIGLTGLILLFLIDVLNFNPVQLAYIMLPVIVFWLILGVALGRAYPRRLQQALRQRSLSGLALLRPDRSGLDILRQGLASPQVGVVLYTLDMLAEIAPENLLTDLPDLLSHPEREVRLEALRRVEMLNLKPAIPLIQARLAAEGSRSVQAASLRTLAALGDQAVFDQVYPYLEHPNLSLRQGAVVGLLRSGELEGILLAGEKLLAWTRSSRPEEREFAAQALGEGGITGFYRPLLSLLQDDRPDVQRAALVAAGKLKHPNLWPLVTACLGASQVRSAAVAALVAGGEAVLPALRTAFVVVRGSDPPAADQQGQPRPYDLARVGGRIGGEAAIALLLEMLDFPDVKVRGQVLASLNRCGYQAKGEAQAMLAQGLRAEAAQATWTLASLVDLEHGLEPGPRPDAIRLLQAALHGALSGQRHRLFLWLALSYDRKAIGQVRTILSQALSEAGHISEQQRDYALEVLELLLPTEQRAMLRPLVEALPPAEQLQHLTLLFPQPRLSLEARLAEIIRAPAAWLEPWAKHCALAAASQPSPELTAALEASLADPDPLLRESATGALARLDPAAYPFSAQLSTTDASGGKVMLTLVEKVMYLKTVDFLAEASEEILAGAAAALVEVEVKAGNTILAKGEPNSALYLVVEGQVSLQEGERNSTILAERELFGELALLNAAVQPVAVVALTDTRLLRLDQAPLFELLEDQPLLARSIIQRLAQRLQRAGQGRAEQARADLLGGLKEKLGRK